MIDCEGEQSALRVDVPRGLRFGFDKLPNPRRIGEGDRGPYGHLCATVKQ